MKYCYIIAEAGVNHNGSEALAFQLVDIAAEAKADAIKFQTFKAEKLVTAKAQKAAYQKTQTGEGDQFTMLKALELSEEAHQRLVAHCKVKGIEFVSTPFDEASADFLVELGVQRLKIGSGELTNIPFLRHLASKGLPLILSTGMGDLDEVKTAVDAIASTRAQCGFTEPLAEVLTVLHCTSNYPTPLSDVNLLAMQTMADIFKLPVGYSDHTQGVFVAGLARALGAVAFEKHFTVDRNLPGPDHAASLEPDELKTLVQTIRNVDMVLGSPIKAPTAPELEVRIAARRSVTLAVDAPAGVPLTADMLVLKRPGSGIPPIELEEIIGRNLRHSMQAGDTLHHADLA